ncbi:MAG: DUF3793 family protein [Anaerotignum sp.]
MSTETIIRHCAPTLAGLKISNLFSCSYGSICELLRLIEEKNALLNEKDVYFAMLKAQKGTALVLVYRKKLLEKTLAQDEIRTFLSPYGYTEFGIEACFSILKEHLLHCEFPHEIGIFLGYPLEDVKGFIEHKGACSKCVGCWKVYTDANDAEKTFRKFKKCTSVYCKKFAEGFDIIRLTVAG